MVKNHFKPALAEAKLPPTLRLYDLRHTAATMRVTAGVPVNVVSERLGHSKTSMTLDKYVHATPNLQAQAAERMEEVLSQNR